jgi:hypothetical protein
MAHTYAGILGLLAMLVVIARGIKNGAGVEGTLFEAFVGLAAFTLVGFVLGKLADHAIQDSVTQQMERELAQQGTADDSSST